MELILVRSGGELRALLSGELDQHSAKAVRDPLDAALAEGDFKRLVFDMKDVTFMDSSGIGVVLGRYKRIAAAGGSMSVINAGGSVEKVLRMSGVYKLCKERRGS